ncbi:MAG: hypothetical protein HZB80_01715 [Deltaproteobacteria bacterium]|nr:hypothetical protein [Deltaproteobacteria bacterium]
MENRFKDILKAIYENIKARSKNLLFQDGYVYPTAFVVVPSKDVLQKIDVICVPLNHRNNEEKQSIFAQLNMLAETTGAVGIIHATECYFRMPVDEKDAHILPSESEDRKEGLMVTLVGNNISMGHLTEFERAGTDITIKRQEEMSGQLKNNLIIAFNNFNA